MSPTRFDHLAHLTDEIGLFEHAELTAPRVEHGYCTDDVARALLVTAREPDPSDQVLALQRTYLTFLGAGQHTSGRFHNRRSTDGRWLDPPSVGDWWGRALWGLGATAASSSPYAAEALRLFDASAVHWSPWSRPMAFAGLGAAEVLTAHPGHRAAGALLRSAGRFIAPAGPGPAGWPWPEPRLRYANGSLPDVLIAAGTALDNPRWTEQGLELLRWLLATETAGDHLSVVPTGGWALGEPRPGFDQQPIEVAALAEACTRALAVTGDPSWGDAVHGCAAWFDGANDSRTVLRDAATGGGYDGLEPWGRNENEGAESTLALIATLQCRDRLLVPAP